MNCYIHPDREAAGTCVGCGKFTCTECNTLVMEKNYCTQCIAKGIPYQSTTQTNALAITSLILGIVSIPTALCYGCGMIFAIAAIVLGLVARNQIKQSGGRQGGDGLALTGLILGSVVVGLVVIGGLCYLAFIVIMLLIPQNSDYSWLPGLWNSLLLI